jgi:hypothetical protein
MGRGSEVALGKSWRRHVLEISKSGFAGPARTSASGDEGVPFARACSHARSIRLSKSGPSGFLEHVNAAPAAWLAASTSILPQGIGRKGPGDTNTRMTSHHQRS